MFRAMKKRKPRLVTTTTTRQSDDEDDEDDDKAEQQVNIVHIKKTKKAKSSSSSSQRPRPRVVPSFVHNDDDNDDNEGEKNTNHGSTKKRPKRLKKRGMGFGGVVPSKPLTNDDDNEGHDEDKEDARQSTDASSIRYDKSTLEKLKSEQRFKKIASDLQQQHPPPQQQQQESITTTTETKAPRRQKHARFNDDDNDDDDDKPNSARSKPLPDFISLKDATANSSNSRHSMDFVSLQDAASGKLDYMIDHDHEPSVVIMTGEEADLLEEKMMMTAGVTSMLDDNDDPNETMMERIHASEQLQQQQQPPSDETKVEETNDWEQQLLRRAGIAAAPTTTTKNQHHSSESSSTNGVSLSSSSSNKNNNNTLFQLRDSIQSTLSQLATQQEDLQVALQRRQVDLQHAQDELQRQHGTELHQAGQALEYYQQLRERLATWVGALRELQTKLRPLAKARWEWEQDVAIVKGHYPWMEWENDMIHVLQQAQLLQQVLGRQPNMEKDKETLSATTPTTATMVDEFGRDVKSQQVLQREQRQRRRKRILQQRQQQASAKTLSPLHHSTTITNSDDLSCWREEEDDDSDAFVSDGEQQELEQRQGALKLAFQVALEEVDEEYTNLSNVVAIFVEWCRAYPEDYRNCFANLSLADLAGVLVDKHLNGDYHPLHWMDHEDHSSNNSNNNISSTVAVAFSWLETLQQPELSPQEKLEESPMYLVLERIVIPYYVQLLDKSIYSLQSSKQSKCLAAMYAWLCDRLSSTNGTAFTNMKSRTVEYLCQEIHNIAIPILKSNSWTASTFTNGSEEVQDAVRSATGGQVHRIVKLIRNVLMYWAPHLADSQSLTETVLEFCSTKFLFLLSSLQAAAAAAACADESAQQSSSLGVIVPASPRMCFTEIYHSLEPTKWLDQPEYMLQGASIRAAAIAYGIHQPPTRME